MLAEDALSDDAWVKLVPAELVNIRALSVSPLFVTHCLLFLPLVTHCLLFLPLVTHCLLFLPLLVNLRATFTRVYPCVKSTLHYYLYDVLVLEFNSQAQPK
jgi:hypothetical protein